jgi:hypothetical protein
MEPSLLKYFEKYRVSAEKAYNEWNSPPDDILNISVTLPAYTKFDRVMNQAVALTGKYILKALLLFHALDPSDPQVGIRYGRPMDLLWKGLARFGIREWNRIFLPTFGSASAKPLDHSFARQLAGLLQRVSGGFEDWRRTHHPSCSMKAAEKAARVTWFAIFWSVMHGRTTLADMELEYIWNYSMLYPYVDDFLDSPDDSYRVQRKQFILDLRQSLSQTHKIHDFYYHPNRIPFMQCLRIIKGAAIKQGPMVGDEIAAALEILAVIEGDTEPTYSEPDIIFHSCMKGTLAMLPLCTLITGTVPPSDMDLLFKYGLAFQLVDDIQDIQEDRMHIPQTIFTSKAELGKNSDLEAIKTLNYLSSPTFTKSTSHSSIGMYSFADVCRRLGSNARTRVLSDLRHPNYHIFGH